MESSTSMKISWASGVTLKWNLFQLFIFPWVLVYHLVWFCNVVCIVLHLKGITHFQPCWNTSNTEQLTEFVMHENEISIGIHQLLLATYIEYTVNISTVHCCMRNKRTVADIWTWMTNHGLDSLWLQHAIRTVTLHKLHGKVRYRNKVHILSCILCFFFISVSCPRIKVQAWRPYFLNILHCYIRFVWQWWKSKTWKRNDLQIFNPSMILWYAKFNKKNCTK